MSESPTAAKKKASRPKKTAAAKAAAPVAAAPADDHLTPGDRKWVAQQTALAEGGPRAVEVMLEDVPDGYLAVPLGPEGDIVHVAPRGKWRSSTFNALQTGDFEGWAQRVLAPGEYESVWMRVDPDLDEIQEMMAVLQKLAGDMGKPATPTSLRRMAMR